MIYPMFFFKEIYIPSNTHWCFVHAKFRLSRYQESQVLWKLTLDFCAGDEMSYLLVVRFEW